MCILEAYIYWRYVEHYIYNDGENYRYIWVTCNLGALHGGVLYVNRRCFRHIMLYIIMERYVYTGGVYARGMQNISYNDGEHYLYIFDL